MEAPPKKRRREICSRCDRPKPSTCICAALPLQPFRLEHCRCLVLQHPHEKRRKNRSLPLMELCLDADSLVVWQARTLQTPEEQGSSSTAAAARILSELRNDTTRPCWLVYPSPDATPLTPQAVSQQLANTTNHPVTLLFLDATWKFAKEMHQKNLDRHFYPSQTQYVCLPPIPTHTENWIPRRFALRTPVSDDLLSTAECLARIVAQLEQEDHDEERTTTTPLLEALLAPLDLMVQQWHERGKPRPTLTESSVATTESHKK